MPMLDLKKLNSYRARSYHMSPFRRVRTQRAARAFVNERGFIYFWPIKGIELPSLWTAVAGNRTVADNHDDPGHITWSWKDNALGKKVWYYAKILRKKATMISLDVAPYVDPLIPPQAARDLSAPRLWQLSLTMQWGDGNDPRQRIALQSLRLVTPTAQEALSP